MNLSNQEQVRSAVKYFLSQFPLLYKQFKQKFQGQKYFQIQLDVLHHAVNNPKYVTLRLNFVDMLLIKLRFIALNQCYLQNLQQFLLEKFIKICFDSMKSTLDIQKIYNNNNKENQQNNKIKNSIFQRYSIISQSLIYILKFCFNKSKYIYNTNSSILLKFQNQMLKQNYSKNQKLPSKGFVKFILELIGYILEDIIKYKIIDIQKIYPKFFSILCDGFLTYKGGMKCLEIINSLLIKIIDANKDNIWICNINKNSIQSRLQILNKQINLNMLQNKQKQNKISFKSKQKQAIDYKKQEKDNNIEIKFEDQCKKRLLICLQTLLARYGYNLFNDQSNNYNSIKNISLLNDQVQQNSIKIIKLRKFIQNMIQVIEKRCFQTKFNNSNNIKQTTIIIKNMNPYQLQLRDKKILISLVILFIEFESQAITQISNPKSLSSYSSLLIQSLISNTNHKINFSQPKLLNQIKEKIKQIFLQKFRLILNKNKIIATSKSYLLKQLKNITKFVSFELFQQNQIQQICIGFDQLFKPLEKQFNKPIIIIKNSDISQEGGISRHSIPLVDLKPTDSFVTYSVSLNALLQSMKFQQKRYILDDIKLFNWLQGEQINLNYFKNLISNFDLRMKLKLFNYFEDQIMNMQKEQTEQIYSLNMSLVKFYKLITILFYLDNLFCKQNGILSPKSILLLRSKQYSVQYRLFLSQITQLQQIIQQNYDIKRLLISKKQQELLIFWTLKITYGINQELMYYESLKNSSALKKNYSKLVIFQNLVLQMSHQTYLLKLLSTYLLLQHSAPSSISQALIPLQSTLIHRNGGKSLNKNGCNLQFMKNLIKICNLKSKQAQQLAQIYLSKSFISKSQANQVISLLFSKLSPQTKRKCILSIKNWYLIFMKKQNIELLNNQPMIISQKQQLFHSNDRQNVTISNALGVIVLELGQKWVAQLQFKNPKKQILFDCMINLIQVNDKLIFWKRFFFQNILIKITNILKEIQIFEGSSNNKNNKNQKQILKNNNDNRNGIYDRLKNKIIKLLYKIPKQFYQFSLHLGQKSLQKIKQIKIQLQKQYKFLKIQCFVKQKYQKYLQNYKMTNTILENIDQVLKLNFQKNKNCQV